VIWLKLSLFWSVPLPFARWLLFSSGSYSYPSPQWRDNLINAISVEEELGVRPNLIRRARGFLLRLDAGHAPRSKKRSVPLEQLKEQTESLRVAAAGAHAPQIDCQLACYGHNGFFASSSGGERAFTQGPAPFDDWSVVGLEADQTPG
jgi:hypothetical protein